MYKKGDGVRKQDSNQKNQKSKDGKLKDMYWDPYSVVVATFVPANMCTCIQQVSLSFLNSKS